MKSLIKKTAARLAQNDIVWAILKGTVIRVADFAVSTRRNTVKKPKQQDSFDIQNEIKSLSPELKVMHGPFKGMLYPEIRSIGSSIAPKILGSYEKELHQIMEQMCLDNYSEIIDIGCAEGYYSIGLALRVPAARIFAYDTNSEAISLCKKMAELNKVEERLETGSFCDANILNSIPLTGKALIISDCEGYERDLFTQEIVGTLKDHDVLIEVHDFIDIEISTTIRQRFELTHSIISVLSIDDITKAHIYDYEELRGYKLEDRKRLLAEYRPQIMEWLYMKPHQG